MPISATTPTLIQSLQRGLKLVGAITENGPLSAKSISDSTGIVLPTAYHLLRTLIYEEYLRRLADGRYDIGPQLVSVTQLEGRARRHRVVRELMSELAAATRAHVLISTACGGGIVVRSIVEDPRAPRIDCCAGTMIPAHATAIGKSILSRMSPTLRQEHLRHNPLSSYTTQTAATVERLNRDLAKAEPIAYSEQEYLYGVSCVAVGLCGTREIGAVALAYSSSRTSRVRAHNEDLLVQCAERIDKAMFTTGASLTSVAPS